LSTLTKILIVLLTLSSIFLCGIVATYVASADNYKQLYETERITRQDAVTKKNDADGQLDKKKKEFQQSEDELRSQIASLETEVKQLQVELTDLEIEKATLVQKVSGMATTVEASSQTAEQQRQLFQETFNELKQLKAVQIKEREQLNDLTNKLMEKLAIIDSQQKEIRRLEEERAGLRKQLSDFQLQVGREPAPPKLVTPEEAVARPAPPVVQEIGLKGLITAVDPKNALAEISIGRADGVKEGMRFFVTRGDKFVCEILTFYVDVEKAVGILERVRYQPKAGDTVSTNL
jgi:septal ring factor EnvC (AmiA/AmiB activator)